MIAKPQQVGAVALPLLKSSVSQKLVVSISGLFLVIFLVVHLSVNLTLLAGADTYNSLANWMGSTPPILAMRPVLALGVIAHVLVSAWLWLANLRVRPERYDMVDPAGGSTWASRNMLVLGVVVLLFLVLHVSSFAIPLTFGEPAMVEVKGILMKDAYGLVTDRFSIWWYSSIYVVAVVFLGLHLSHGVQSALQTLGLSDALWRRRWTVVGNLYSVIVTVGFAILPVYFLIQALVSSAP